VDTVVGGKGEGGGSSLGQRLRRQVAAKCGRCLRTERTQPAGNESCQGRFAKLAKIEISQALGPEGDLKPLVDKVTGGPCDSAPPPGPPTAPPSAPWTLPFAGNAPSAEPF